MKERQAPQSYASVSLGGVILRTATEKFLTLIDLVAPRNVYVLREVVVSTINLSIV